MLPTSALKSSFPDEPEMSTPDPNDSSFRGSTSAHVAPFLQGFGMQRLVVVAIVVLEIVVEVTVAVVTEVAVAVVLVSVAVVDVAVVGVAAFTVDVAVAFVAVSVVVPHLGPKKPAKHTHSKPEGSPAPPAVVAAAVVDTGKGSSVVAAGTDVPKIDSVPGFVASGKSVGRTAGMLAVVGIAVTGSKVG